MTAHGAFYGRLGKSPRTIDTKSGTPMCVSSLAVELSDKDGEKHTQWLDICCFGRLAEQLAAHDKGTLISISGRLQINRWQNAEGQEQTSLQIIGDSLVSARSVRPGGGKKKSGDQSDAQVSEKDTSTEPADFDDAVPF